MPKISILALFLGISLSACSTVSYYNQSIHGQMELLFYRESIEKIILNPETPRKLKINLQQAQNIRQYASKRLALPDNKSYQYYTDIKRPYVVWNVFAAPEFSLTPTHWCYPIAGCVSYRGYFNKQNAEQAAKKLSEDGLDVYVGGVTAYSTLGWFDDPLLNTMLHWKQHSLAGLIFHELSHQVIYIQDETAFNEAFASSVERLGTIQWLLENQPEQIRNYLAYLDAQRDFRELLLATREKLSTLYKNTLTKTEKQNRKQEIFKEMILDYNLLKTSWSKGIHFDAWFEKKINNARLSSTMTYLKNIPAFYQIFLEKKGEWSAFYKAVINLKKLSPEKRKNLISKKSNQKISYLTLTQLISKNIAPP